MKCDEARPLQGAYLDSELDARTTAEIDQHLKSCAECANLFAEEASQEARMRAGLNRGERTAALWERIERSVAVATRSSGSAPDAFVRPQPTTGRSVITALSEQVRAGWRRSRFAWSALAAGWAVIFILNLSGPEAETAASPAASLPPASEVRLAMKQKRLLSAGLAALSEPAPAKTGKAMLWGPRSERRHQNLNS